MIPKGSEAIGHLVTRIAMDLIPKAGDAYTATDLGYLTVLMSMIGQDYERGAEVLVTEEVEIAQILSQAASNLDPGLRLRITEALKRRPASLRMSDLAARTDLLMKLLIDAHAAVEDAEAAGADWAAPLNAEIWRFLEAHVARHAYEVML